jgi:hypothetical protein
VISLPFTIVQNRTLLVPSKSDCTLKAPSVVWPYHGDTSSNEGADGQRDDDKSRHVCQASHLDLDSSWLVRQDEPCMEITNHSPNSKSRLGWAFPRSKSVLACILMTLRSCSSSHQILYFLKRLSFAIGGRDITRRCRTQKSHRYDVKPFPEVSYII